MTAPEAFAILKQKASSGNFDDIFVGDYIDIPDFIMDGTIYINNSEYQNLRVVIAGFNIYNENTILFAFRNCPILYDYDHSNYTTMVWTNNVMRMYLESNLVPGLQTAIGVNIKEVFHGIYCYKIIIPNVYNVFGKIYSIKSEYTEIQSQCGSDWQNDNIQYPLYKK